MPTWTYSRRFNRASNPPIRELPPRSAIVLAGAMELVRLGFPLRGAVVLSGQLIPADLLLGALVLSGQVTPTPIVLLDRSASSVVLSGRLQIVQSLLENYVGSSVVLAGRISPTPVEMVWLRSAVILSGKQEIRDAAVPSKGAIVLGGSIQVAPFVVRSALVLSGRIPSVETPEVVLSGAAVVSGTVSVVVGEVYETMQGAIMLAGSSRMPVQLSLDMSSGFTLGAE